MNHSRAPQLRNSSAHRKSGKFQADDRINYDCDRTVVANRVKWTLMGPVFWGRRVSVCVLVKCFLILKISNIQQHAQLFGSELHFAPGALFAAPPPGSPPTSWWVLSFVNQVERPQWHSDLFLSRGCATSILWRGSPSKAPVQESTVANQTLARWKLLECSTLYHHTWRSIRSSFILKLSTNSR